MIAIHRRAVVDEYRQFSFNRNSVAFGSNGRLYYPHQARFESVSGRTGVLVEEGTTNLLKHSEALDNTSSWARTELATVTPVAGASPAGTTAYVLVPTTANLAHSLVQGVTVAGGSGVYITLSCYFKAKEYNHARLTVRINDGSANRWPLAVFRLTDGTVTRLDGRGVYTVSAQAVNVGGGWWRCALTVQVPAGHAVMDVQINASNNTGAEYFAGDGASGVYAWGAQLETKAYMTSYMPTTSSSTTRAAETLTVPTAGVLYPQEGTVEIWVYFDDVHFGNAKVGGWIWGSSTSGYNDYIVLQRTNSLTIRFHVRVGGGAVQAAEVPISSVTKGWHLIAAKWSSAELALFVDGVRVASRSNPVLPLQIAPIMSLGYNHVSGQEQWGAPIGPLRISRRARTDQEIADAYAAGTLTADADTTLLLPFTGPDAQRGARVIYVPSVA